MRGELWNASVGVLCDWHADTAGGWFLKLADALAELKARNRSGLLGTIERAHLIVQRPGCPEEYLHYVELDRPLDELLGEIEPVVVRLFEGGS